MGKNDEKWGKSQQIQVIMQIMEVKDARDIPAPILNRHAAVVAGHVSGHVCLTVDRNGKKQNVGTKWLIKRKDAFKFQIWKPPVLFS